MAMTPSERDACCFDLLLTFMVRADMCGGDRLRDLLTDAIARSTEADETKLLIAALDYLHTVRSQHQPL